MPMVIAAAVAYIAPATAAYGVVVGTYSVAFSTLIGYAAVIGGAVAYGASQNAKLRNSLSSLSQAGQGTNVMARDPLADRRSIYGQVPVTGPVVFMATSGTKNEILHVVVALAGRECAELGDISFDNGEVVPLDGSGNATGKYSGYFHCEKFRGLPEQGYCATLVTAVPSLWTTAHRLYGIAYLYCACTYSPDLYPNGVPTIKCLVKGNRVHDPRIGVVRSCDVGANNRNIGISDTSGISVGDSVWGAGIPDGSVVGSINPNVTITLRDTDPGITNAALPLTFGSVVWSANSALCVADYRHDPIFGSGTPWSRINLADLPNEANICDEQILLNDGVTYESRYTTHGAITTAQDATADLLGAMAGRMVDTGGVWSFYAGAYSSSVCNFNDSDLIGAFSVQPRQSMRSSYNGVKGTYLGNINDWMPADAPAITGKLAAAAIVAGNKVSILTVGTTDFTLIGAPSNSIGATFIATGAGTGTGYVDPFMGADGGKRRWKDTSLPFTTSPATSQRLFKIDLLRGRQQLVVTGLYKLKAFKVRCANTIQITRSALGWTNKEFEVLTWGFQPVQSADGMSLGIMITAQETASSIYDWADGEEKSADDAPNTNLPNPQVVAAPSGVTLLTDSSTNIFQTDGTYVPRLKVNWSTPNNIFVENGGLTVIEYKKHSDSTWLEWTRIRGDKLSDFITDVKIGTTCDVRVYFINQIGVRSNTNGTPIYGEVDNYTIAGDTAAPATPSGLSAAAGTGKSVSVTWTANTEVDLLEYKVYRNTVNTLGTAALIATLTATRLVDLSVALGTTYYYWLDAVDTSGNASVTAAGSVNATPTGVATGGSVSSPTASSQTGSGVYLATDGTTLCYEEFTIKALPTGAAEQQLLYKNHSDSTWMVAGQYQNGSDLTGVRVRDLSPGISYDFAVQAYNSFGDVSTIVNVTSSPFTTPNAAAPAAPTGLTVSVTQNDVAPAPVKYRSPTDTGTKMGVARASWTASTSLDVDHYEINIASLVGIPSPYDDQNIRTSGTETSIFFYNNFVYDIAFTPNNAEVRVRAISRSGVASSWTSFLDCANTYDYGTKTMAIQDASSVAITGGTVAGITDMAVADGGTGSSTAPGALTNLGLGTTDVPQFGGLKLGGAVGDSRGISYGGGTTNEIAFYWDGSNVRAVVDGSLQGTIPNP